MLFKSKGFELLYTVFVNLLRVILPVRKAAKFAVYEDIIISVKNHHIPATIRVDTALKHLYCG